MLVFKQGSPEARLADLFALMEQCGKAQHFTAGPGAADLDGAVAIARRAISEQIRLISAELGEVNRGQANPDTMTPVRLADLKQGDEVWIRATVDRVETKDQVFPLRVLDVEQNRLYPTTGSVFRRG